MRSESWGGELFFLCVLRALLRAPAMKFFLRDGVTVRDGGGAGVGGGRLESPHVVSYKERLKSPHVVSYKERLESPYVVSYTRWASAPARGEWSQDWTARRSWARSAGVRPRGSKR